MSVTELQTGKQGQQKPLARVSVTSLRGMKDAGRKDRYADRLRLLDCQASRYSRHTTAAGGRLAGQGHARLRLRSARDHGRHAPPHQSGYTWCVPRPCRGRYAFHELHDQRGGSHAQRCPSHAGGRSASRQNGGRHYCPHDQAAGRRWHSRYGPPRPHAPVYQRDRRPQDTGQDPRSRRQTPRRLPWPSNARAASRSCWNSCPRRSPPSSAAS